MTFKPMLSAKLKAGQTYEDDFFPRIKLPLMASPKLDGIRCFMHPDLGPVTRTLKPIPNVYLREKLLNLYEHIEGFDGELVLGDHESPDYSFHATQSAVMSQGGEPTEVSFHVFDALKMNEPEEPFMERSFNYYKTIIDLEEPFLRLVPQRTCVTLQDLLDVEVEYLERNYEGVMTRDVSSGYKFGRSTLVQQGLVALKRFEDAEAVIIGIEEMYNNNNVAETDAFGNIKRSSSQAGLSPADTMGRLKVRGVEGSRFAGVEFFVGSGAWTAHDRRQIWINPEDYLGKIITYKYQSHSVKDKPRLPIFKAFRLD